MTERNDTKMPILNSEELKKQQEILFDDNNIPEEFRSAMEIMAWDNGHAFGYEEVMVCLRSIVYSFAKPIAEFEKRITKKSS